MPDCLLDEKKEGKKKNSELVKEKNENNKSKVDLKRIFLEFFKLRFDF